MTVQDCMPFDYLCWWYVTLPVFPVLVSGKCLDYMGANVPADRSRESLSGKSNALSSMSVRAKMSMLECMIRTDRYFVNI